MRKEKTVKGGTTIYRLVFFQIIIISFLLLFIEGSGQALYYLKYNKWYGGVKMITNLEKDSMIISHSNIGYALRPNYENNKTGIFLNPLGFRDDEIKKKKKDNIRILLLGDSCAFGWHRNSYTDQNKLFARQLEKHLGNKINKEIDVINAGVPGYSSYEVLLSFREYRPKLKPDYIIIYAGFNDIGIGISKGLEGNQNIMRTEFDNSTVITKRLGLAEKLNEYLTFKSVAYSKLRNLLTGFGKGQMGNKKYQDNSKITLHNELIFKNYYGNIKTLIYEAKQTNTQVFLISLATIVDGKLSDEETERRKRYFSTYDDYKFYYQLTEKLNEVLNRIHDEDNIPLFKLDQKLLGLDKTKLFVDHIHFSNDGHRIVGEFLSSKLEPILRFVKISK